MSLATNIHGFYYSRIIETEDARDVVEIVVENRDDSEEMVTTLVNNPELQRLVQEWVSPGSLLASASLCQVLTKTMADIR